MLQILSGNCDCEDLGPTDSRHCMSYLKNNCYKYNGDLENINKSSMDELMKKFCCRCAGKVS